MNKSNQMSKLLYLIKFKFIIIVIMIVLYKFFYFDIIILTYFNKNIF